jgi:hypothetical protein
VLNELEEDVERRALLLERLAGHLAPGGAIIVLEPALKEITRDLMRLRDRIAAGGSLAIVAPCTHGQPCPMLAKERDWCHAEREVALPERLAAIARGAGLRWEGLSYSYLVLRREAVVRDPSLHRVVSEPLPSKGKLELWACGAEGLVQIRRLDRHRGPATAAIDRARRGSLLSKIEGSWHTPAQATPRKDD